MNVRGRARVRRDRGQRGPSTMPPPGDPARFEVCTSCWHVRLEHSDDGARCDARIDPALLAVDTLAERCTCDAWRTTPLLPPTHRPDPEIP